MAGRMRRLLTIGAALALVVAACSPDTETEEPPAAEPPPTEAPEDEEVEVEPEAPEEVFKRLTIGMSEEPLGFGPAVAQIASNQVEQSVHAGLTFRDGDQRIQPWLVEKVPSLEDGDWLINPDGSMEVTWTLRPDITWHDGTPLTVEDVIFGWEVVTATDLASFGAAEARLIERLEKIDDRTFVAHYGAPYVFADGGIPRVLVSADPLPLHILGEVLESGDPEQFLNHPYWTTEFVGVGPYKLVEWVPGSHIRVEANDDYFLGRPNIDEIIWRWFDDTNTLVANILSGDVDVTVIPNIDLTQAQVLMDQWDDGRVEVLEGFGWDWIAFNTQEAPEFEDVRVRQALLYAIDREAIVEATSGGLNTVADSFMSPVHPLMTDQVMASMTTYPYDPDRALELLADAGYEPGPDGLLVDSDGNTLEIVLRTVAGDTTKEQAQAIIMDQWSQIGVSVRADNLAPAAIFDPEHLFRFGWDSGFLFNFGGGPDLLAGEYRCVNIPTEENGWSGANLGMYCSEEYDAAYEEQLIEETLEVEEREAITARLMEIWTNDLPLLPLYFKSVVYTARDGVTGLHPSGTNEGWLGNVHEWDISG